MAEDEDKRAGQTGPDAPDGDDPGAGKSAEDAELDPELLRLPRPRTRIGPVLAASVVVFCLYMMVTLRHDLAFSRAGDTPVRVDSVQQLLGGAAGPDELVALGAVPDRAAAARLGSSEADDGYRVAPALGSGGRVWLVLPGNVWAADISYQEVYTGRLRGFDHVPFADELESWVREQPPAPRFVTGKALRETASAGASTIVAATGDTIHLRPDTPVELRVERSDRTEIHAPLTGTRTDEAAWRSALAAAGVPIAAVRPAGDRPEGDDVHAEDEPDQPVALIFTTPLESEAVSAALARHRLLEAWAEPVVEHLQTSFGALSVTAAGFDVGGRTVAAGEVEWGAVTAARTVGDDALLLITGEHPDAYWYILPLYIVLGLFAMLFCWGLIRSLRQEPETSP